MLENNDCSRLSLSISVSIFDFYDHLFEGHFSSTTKEAFKKWIEKQLKHIERFNDGLLTDLKESFHHFDTDHDGVLTKEEFKAAAAAVGVSLKDGAELNSVVTAVSEGHVKGHVNEDQYVKYLISLTEDKDTPEQIKASFKQLANDNSSITADQLMIPPMTKEDAAYLASVMPKHANGGLDYIAFVDSNFASQ